MQDCGKNILDLFIFKLIYLLYWFLKFLIINFFQITFNNTKIFIIAANFPERIRTIPSGSIGDGRFIKKGILSLLNVVIPRFRNNCFLNIFIFYKFSHVFNIELSYSVPLEVVLETDSILGDFIVQAITFC